MGTYKYKDIWEGQEIYKKVVKVIIEVLFSSVWQESTLSEVDQTSQSH